MNRKEFNNKSSLAAGVVGVSATIQGKDLNTRDGFGLWNTEGISVISEKASQILLM
jgi:hypothetical protein